MSLNRHDPRVKKTRRGLREAFIRLILRQGYDSISIQDIASEAETARITFYRHYRDKEALLTDCLNELYEELVEKTEHQIAQGAPLTSLPTQIFYEHLEAQERLYHVLFTSLGTQTVVARMQDFMASRLLENMPKFAHPQRPNIPDDIIAHHLVSAQVGLGIWWLQNNKPYPVAYLTQIAMWLSMAGLQRALGLEHLPLPAPDMPAPPAP